ncbi:MAG: PilZ domain-containing protein [Solirubrobacteraceae bacterium]
MRRLQRDQPVTLQLDDGKTRASVACRVADVYGSIASFAYDVQLDPGVRERLDRGVLCYLIFAYRGMQIVLHGMAVAAPHKGVVIDFVVNDGIQVRERRRGRRERIVISVRLTPINGDGVSCKPIDTFTRDLSASGALVSERPGLSEHARFELELFLPHERTPIRAQAIRRRVIPEGIGIAFGQLIRSDQVRLSQLLAAHHHASHKAGRQGDEPIALSA